MGLTKHQLAGHKAAETRKKIERFKQRLAPLKLSARAKRQRLEDYRKKLRAQKKPSKPKKKASKSRSDAAHKAWATRRDRVAVGFYKDEKKKTRPITKPAGELKRKKVIQKPKTFRAISPKARAKPLSRWFPKGVPYDEHGVYEFLAQHDSIVKKEAEKGKTTTLERLFRQIDKRFGKKVGDKWRSRISPKKVLSAARKGSKAEQLSVIMEKAKGKKWAQKARKGMKKGALKELGYDPYKSALSRHMALNRSIKKVGLETTRRRIQYLANVTPDKKRLDKIYKEDLAWLAAKKQKTKPRDVPARVVKPEAKRRMGLGLKSCRHTKELHAEGIGEIKRINPKVFRQPPKKTWTRRSRSNPDKEYTVRLNQDNSLSCNCPGWIFSKG